MLQALCTVFLGEVWNQNEIQKRQNEIGSIQNGQPSTLHRDVVDSLPVSEDIKKQKGEMALAYPNLLPEL